MPETVRVPHRPLGRSGIDVSRIGLAGSFGVDADATERAFHELGVNYFFVTPRMRGLVEGLQRLIRAGHRDKLVIAAGAAVPLGWSVQRAWEKRARLFGVEQIDVFHLFWVQAHWYVTGNTWPSMARLKAEGKARALAISCHDRPMARRLVDELDLDVMMIRYNAAHRGAEGEIFATLPERKPGVVAYTATRWGKLLKPVGEEGPMSAPECYRFSVGHPSVDLVLCGARNFDEVRQAAEGVASGVLPDDRLVAVRRFGDKVRATATGRLGFLGR